MILFFYNYFDMLIYDLLGKIENSFIPDDRRKQKWDEMQKVVKDKMYDKTKFGFIAVALDKFLLESGMYRGKINVIKKSNPNVLLELINKVFTTEEFHPLLDIKTLDEYEEKLELNLKFYEIVSNHLNNALTIAMEKEMKVTDTLISKIMFGLLGCCIVYAPMSINKMKKVNDKYHTHIFMRINNVSEYKRSNEEIISLIRNFNI